MVVEGFPYSETSPLYVLPRSFELVPPEEEDPDVEWCNDTARTTPITTTPAATMNEVRFALEFTMLPP